MGKPRQSNVFKDSNAYHDDISLASSAVMSYPCDSFSEMSMQSDTSSFLQHPQRSCPCFPMAIDGSSSVYSQSTMSTYMEAKRDEMNRSSYQDQLQIAEIRLRTEKTRGNLLLVVCVIMTLFCSIIFMDEINDWKASLIEHLEKDEETSQKIGNTADLINSTIEPIPKALNTNATQNLVPTFTPTKQIDYESHSHAVGGIEADMDSSLDERVAKLSFLNKWNVPFHPLQETPVFWHVPRAGGGKVDEIFSHCYHLVQAGDNAGSISGHETETSLQVINNADGGGYVNVNMGTMDGIQRAKDLKLTSWPDPFYIQTPYIFETAELFYSGNYGKGFTMLRHPVERAIDVFQHLKDIKAPVFVDMTLEEYVQSPYCEQNWMVRFLSDEMSGTIGQEHLQMAKVILGGKFIIGFTDLPEESILRFAKYFQWDQEPSIPHSRDCVSKLLSQDYPSSSNEPISPYDWRVPVSKDPKYGAETPVWQTLSQHNSLDMELYEYARYLYTSQTMYFKRL